VHFGWQNPSNGFAWNWCGAKSNRTMFSAGPSHSISRANPLHLLFKIYEPLQPTCRI